MTDNIITASIAKEMKDSYLEYSMMVILSRALPDMRDGLKPIQRRLLYAMHHDLHVGSDKPFKKSAKIDGITTGTYSPHGSAYGALVNLAQPFKLPHVYVDGQGNFGSANDGPASSRYTEARLTAFSEDCLLQGLKTTPMRPNYDDSTTEPISLNTYIPNLLLSGATGIGVGFACNFPVHNFRELVKAIQNPKSAEKYLIPDFPGGCDIVEDEGLKSYIETGRGSIRMRAKCEEGKVERSGRKADYLSLSFTNLPYGSSTEKIGDQLKKALDKGTLTVDLKEIQDLSDRSGDCIQLNFKAGTDLNLAKAEVYANCDLDCKLNANSTAIYGMKPEEKSPGEYLQQWFAWRKGQFVEELEYEKSAVESRLEILTGYIKALLNIDLVVSIIRKSENRQDAHRNLLNSTKLGLNDTQVGAVLELRLHRLTSLDMEDLKGEQSKLAERCEEITKLLNSGSLRESFLYDQLKALATRHGHKRMSDLIRLDKAPAPVRKARAVAAKKIRYVGINESTCVASQLKTAKGATVTLDGSSKFIVVSKSGQLAKHPARATGPLFSEPHELEFAADVGKLESIYYVVFKDAETYKGIAINSDDLIRCTSKGKALIPQGYELVYFGSSHPNFKLTRKRKNEISLKGRSDKPGQKGVTLGKVNQIKEIT